MKPIKITIQGSYLDCQLYRGWLYLWTFDGRLCVYDWESLIDSFNVLENAKLALRFSFKEGSYLYRHHVLEILQDSEFKNLLVKKFNILNEYTFVISEHHLRQFLIGEMDIPSLSLPIDTEIYNSILYYATDKGLFKSNAHKTEGNPVSSKPTKLWDARILSLKANNFPRMAISAGDDGLFEMSMSKEELKYHGLIQVERNISKISDKHSSFSNYSNLSIYSSSLSSKSYLALFAWKECEECIKTYRREYTEILDATLIFGDERDNLSWGVDGKIFRVNPNGFNIVEFNNSRRDQLFFKKKDYNEPLRKGSVISGTSAFFGNIVEFENGLTIIQTDGEHLSISQPVTRWRVYPRSNNYSNQLHVLLDDRMEIFAFNHDYFLPQENKELGIDFCGDEMKDGYKRRK